MESIQNLITRLKNSESRTSNSNINKIDTFLIIENDSYKSDLRN